MKKNFLISIPAILISFCLCASVLAGDHGHKAPKKVGILLVAFGSSLPGAQVSFENIDKNMGRLLAFLDDKGVADNTILIFTTDNGGRGLYRGGKNNHYDGGTRVPCFVRWKNGGVGGQGKGRDVTPLTAHIDWLPTFMDILGFHDVSNRPANLPIHGKSFKTLLDEDPANDPGTGYKGRKITIVNMRKENMQKYYQLSVKKDNWQGHSIVNKWRLVRKDSRSHWELYTSLDRPRLRESCSMESDLRAKVSILWTTG